MTFFYFLKSKCNGDILCTDFCSRAARRHISTYCLTVKKKKRSEASLWTCLRSRVVPLCSRVLSERNPFEINGVQRCRRRLRRFATDDGDMHMDNSLFSGRGSGNYMIQRKKKWKEKMSRNVIREIRDRGMDWEYSLSRDRSPHEVLKRAGGTYRVPHTYWKSSLSPASLSKWRPVNRQCPQVSVKLVLYNHVKRKNY